MSLDSSAQSATVMEDAINGDTAISTNMSAPSPAGLAAVAINPNAKTFLDLPGELRNQIYAELLPNIEDDAQLLFTQYVKVRSPLRKDSSEKTSTAFMSTCKIVYHEAASILYAPVEVDSAVNLFVDAAGAVTFLGKTTPLEEITPGQFAALKRFKSLQINIKTANSKRYALMCDVQDALFAVCNNVRADHKLQALRVDISTPDEQSNRHLRYWWGTYAIDSLGQVKPGDVSRAHIAAFLLDPLRMIRGLQNGNRKARVHINFIGHYEAPWRGLQPQLRSLLQSDAAVHDCKIFCAYFTYLRRIRSIVKCYQPNDHVTDHFVKKLGLARIKGDVQDFRNSHHDLLEHVRWNLSKQLSTERTKIPNQEPEKRMQASRELLDICKMLEGSLPRADSDTSFFGYSTADDALRKWQTEDCAAAKRAIAKRKREEDEREGKEGPSRTETLRSHKRR